MINIVINFVVALFTSGFATYAWFLFFDRKKYRLAGVMFAVSIMIAVITAIMHYWAGVVVLAMFLFALMLKYLVYRSKM